MAYGTEPEAHEIFHTFTGARFQSVQNRLCGDHGDAPGYHDPNVRAFAGRMLEPLRAYGFKEDLGGGHA